MMDSSTTEPGQPAAASQGPAGFRAGLLRLAAVAGLVWFTTARHEASHAMMVWLEGSELRRVRLLPGYEEEVGFYFGLVERSGGSWLVSAAPFVVATVSLLLCIAWARRLRAGSRGRLAVVLLGVVSPLADLVYNYQGGFWREATDVAKLLAVLPPVGVHLFFVGSIAAGILGLLALRTHPVVRS